MLSADFSALILEAAEWIVATAPATALTPEEADGDDPNEIVPEE